MFIILYVQKVSTYKVDRWVEVIGEQILNFPGAVMMKIVAVQNMPNIHLIKYF
mgnify:CR=1 FL=1